MATCRRGKSQRLTVHACRDAGGRFATRTGGAVRRRTTKRSYKKVNRKGFCIAKTVKWNRKAKRCGCKTIGGGQKWISSGRCKRR